jgi:hypothetical protein
MKRDMKFVIVFFLMSLISMLLVEQKWFELVWFCNHIPFLFFILILLKRKDIIQGVLNTAMLIQITYLINMIAFIFNKDFIWFVNRYLSSQNGFQFFLVFILHMSSVFALMYVNDTKPKPIIFKYSLIYGFVVYSIGFVINRQANCAVACFNTKFNVAFIYFAIILITYEIQKVIYYCSNKFKN